MQALIIDKEGKIRYIPNLPEKKNFGRPNDFIYALDQSVDSAIMVKNQEYAKVLIESKHSSLIIDAAIYLGIPYEFPDLKVRIENIEHGGHPDVDFGLGYTEQIAIIEEEKGEERFDKDLFGEKVPRIYFKAATVKEDDGFMQCNCGISSLDNATWVVTTNNLHADEIPEECVDSQMFSQLVAKLLNHYFNK